MYMYYSAIGETLFVSMHHTFWKKFYNGLNKSGHCENVLHLLTNKKETIFYVLLINLVTNKAVTASVPWVRARTATYRSLNIYRCARSKTNSNYFLFLAYFETVRTLLRPSSIKMLPSMATEQSLMLFLLQEPSHKSSTLHGTQNNSEIGKDRKLSAGERKSCSRFKANRNEWTYILPYPESR